MKIEVFDVEHGQCAMITCPPDGKKLMIDVGHNTGSGWRPSQHYRGSTIHAVVFSNFDEDHTSDLVALRQNCTIPIFVHNHSIDSRKLAMMKAEHGMGMGVRNIYQWLQAIEQNPNTRAIPLDLGDVTVRTYYNSYGTGPGQFTDANNLSVATFVTYRGFTILFPGDLEVAGWRQIIQQPGFIQDLYATNVLVASHHGRENGCCEDVFLGWNPQAVIISDAGLQHATQETRNWYAARSRGCTTTQNVERKVFTTRSDGKITIDVTLNGSWHITTGSPLGALATLLTSGV